MQPGGPSNAQDNDKGVSDRDAAASIVRDQIDRIYGADDDQQAQTPSASTQSPYHRTHNPGSLHEAAPANDDTADPLKRYHSAWQAYYQEYYQRYYLHHLNEQQKQQGHKQQDEPSDKTSKIKSEVTKKVKERAEKVRKSHHFMPIASAIVVGLLFLFAQYNQLLVAQVKAYVSPGSTSAQNIIVDPTQSTSVSKDPRIIIPKLNVDAPTVYDVRSLEENVIQNALKSGVVHYPIPGANSVPGQAGNAVFLGHSSNDVFDSGDYKFVFVLLERMEKGDTFYINYQGTRYTYSVTSKEVIDPSEVSKLVKETDKPLATLVTCVPPGTALKRLVVYAEQISPDPSGAAKANTNEGDQQPDTITGNAPTFLERLFGQ